MLPANTVWQRWRTRTGLSRSPYLHHHYVSRSIRLDCASGDPLHSYKTLSCLPLRQSCQVTFGLLCSQETRLVKRVVVALNEQYFTLPFHPDGICLEEANRILLIILKLNNLHLKVQICSTVEPAGV